MIGSKLQLGVVAAALSTDPRRAATMARESRFAGLAFDAISPAFDITELSQTGRREFAQVLRSNDQQLVGLRVDVGVKGFLPGTDVDRILSQMLKVMEAAKGISTAPLVFVDLGPLPQPAAEAKPVSRIAPQDAGLIIIPEAPPPPQESRPVPGPDPAVVAAVDNALAELCALADRTGVTVAARSDLASFAALHRAVAAARCPWLGMDLDPVGILRDEWSPDEIFSRLGPLICHVLGRDALAGADKRTRPAPIGSGSTDWGKLLNDLDAAGYRGWITLDPMELPDRRAAAAHGAAHIRTFAP